MFSYAVLSFYIGAFRRYSNAFHFVGLPLFTDRGDVFLHMPPIVLATSFGIALLSPALNVMPGIGHHSINFIIEISDHVVDPDFDLRGSACPVC
jgi:hypothetical protein